MIDGDASATDPATQRTPAPSPSRPPHNDAALILVMTQDASAIATFWNWFRANDANLRAMPDADHPFWDVALEQLQLVNPDLWFEMSNEIRGRREFVISAESNRALFPLVDAMVAAAPSMSAWRIVALKPALGFDFKHNYEDVEYDPHTMWFWPLESSSHPEDLGLRIAIPWDRDLEERAARFAVFMILESGLGEREFASTVQYIEVVELPDDPAKDGYIELPELPDYIAWKKRQNTTREAE